MNKDTGAKQPIIEGLPMGFQPNGSPVGPTFVVKEKHKSFLIGIGNGDILAPSGSDELPNPAGPSSPLFASMIRMEVRGRTLQWMDHPFELTPEDHKQIAQGQKILKINSDGDEAEFSLATQFDKVIRDPEIIVRSSSLFGFGVNTNGKIGYVSDSNRNSIDILEIESGKHRRIIDFPNSASGERPATAVDMLGNGEFVVAILGPLFAPGASSIAKVECAPDKLDGSLDDMTVDLNFIPGLQNAIDVKHIGNGRFLVATLTSAGTGAGQLLYFSSNTATPQILVDNLTFATALTYNEDCGIAYVSELNDFVSGRVWKVEVPQS